MTLSYYREKREIDMVLHSRDMIIPIEVKYQTSVSRSDYKNLLSFMGRYKLDTCILVTRDLFDMYEANGKHIQLIPAWLFLMMAS